MREVTRVWATPGSDRARLAAAGLDRLLTRIACAALLIGGVVGLAADSMRVVLPVFVATLGLLGLALACRVAFLRETVLLHGRAVYMEDLIRHAWAAYRALTPVLADEARPLSRGLGQAIRSLARVPAEQTATCVEVRALLLIDLHNEQVRITLGHDDVDVVRATYGALLALGGPSAA